MKTETRKKPTIWYKQTGNTCPTYGLVMLFSYLTGIKLEEKQFLGVNKTIIKQLRDGDLGAKATVINCAKNSPQEFLRDLNKSPLVCDFTMYHNINYNQDIIHHTEDELIPMGGHRMMILEHDTDTGMIHFANTSGKNKVQKMDFALFYYSLRKYMKMNIINTESLDKTVPMKYDHFGYDWLSAIYSGKKLKGYHPGIDFNFGKPTDDLGFPVLACADGKVIFAGYAKDGFGNKVIIEHEENGKKLWSRYGHGLKLSVKTGDIVKCGQEIMKCGNTGNSFGPHLHFDIWKKKQPSLGSYVYGKSKAWILENYINPKEFLGIK